MICNNLQIDRTNLDLKPLPVSYICYTLSLKPEFLNTKKFAIYPLLARVYRKENTPSDVGVL